MSWHANRRSFVRRAISKAKLGLEALEHRSLLSVSPLPQPGSWTPVTNLVPDHNSAGTMMLLSDGTVMVQGGASASWYQLTPDSTGSYVNGTWSSLASMSTQR